MTVEQDRVVRDWLKEMEQLFKERITAMEVDELPPKPKDLAELRLAMKTLLSFAMSRLDREEYGPCLNAIECLYYVYHPECRRLAGI